MRVVGTQLYFVTTAW